MEQKLNKKEQEAFTRQIADDEIDLVDLFLIIWKRKMMIIAVTLLLTVAAAGISFIMPKVYEVVAILEPGKDAEGKLVENPQSIRENILGGAYNEIVAEKLKISLDEIPKFKASVPKETDLVKISIESDEPQQAVAILQKLLTNISDRIQVQLEIKRELVENEIKIAIVEEKLFPEQIQFVEDLIQKAKQKIMELENSRKRTLPSNEDSMAMLLFLNEIQNQQVFLNTLQGKLITLQKQKDKAKIDISSLRLKLAGIKGTNINKQPTIPDKPIKPKKTLIVALAFILGLMGGIMLAFLAEFMTKVRQQELAEEKTQG
ncbi:MAG: hypothetical protein HGJ93_02870 [Desulfosarcina sp.]|nr:hypothetical protein [Desulfosarcina sp.]MBC2764915.1 hypothetical protein [Desulfosarcina sp.]